MGTSTLLKVKADQVIVENHYPIETEYGTLDSLIYYKGDLVITMSDLAAEISGRGPYVVGVSSITDKAEMKEKLQSFLDSREAA